MNYADVESVDFLRYVYAEMRAVARVTNSLFTVKVQDGVERKRPEVRLEVWHRRTWNRRGWVIDEHCWEHAVGQAKRLLTEWHETGRREVQTVGGVLMME